MLRLPTLLQFTQQAQLMTQQYDNLAQYNAQLSSGKKLVNASDDPVLANQLQATQDYITQLSNYSTSGSLAQTRTGLFFSTVHSAITSMSDVSSIMQKVANGTVQQSDRNNFANQLKGDLATLLNLANSQDASGSYIFAGYNTSSQAYVQTSSGFQYQGGLTPTTIDIGVGVSALYNESGFEVFGDIYTGNGVFTVNASSSNTGGAAISGSVSSSSDYVADNYTVTFAYNTNVPPQLVYSVSGVSSGQVVPPPPATIPDQAPVYQPSGQAGVSTTFNGVTLNITGQPNAGDTFQVQPSTQQSLFDTIQKTINLLENPGTNTAVYSQTLSQLTGSVSQALDHLIAYQSTVGANKGQIDNQVAFNKSTIDAQTIALSRLGDIDEVAVMTLLSQQSLALQATQMGYMKMQQTFEQLLKIT